MWCVICLYFTIWTINLHQHVASPDYCCWIILVVRVYRNQRPRESFILKNNKDAIKTVRILHLDQLEIFSRLRPLDDAVGRTRHKCQRRSARIPDVRYIYTIKKPLSGPFREQLTTLLVTVPGSPLFVWLFPNKSVRNIHHGTCCSVTTSSVRHSVPVN